MDYKSLLEGHEEAVGLGKAFWATLVSGRALPTPTEVGAEQRPWPMVLFLELTLAQLILNIGLRLIFVQPIARFIMGKVARHQRLVSNAKVIKFSQSTLEMLFYSIYFFIGFRVVRPQDWTWPSTLWWKDQPDNRFFADDATFFYIAYCARYVQNFIMVFLEPKRKDFIEMQIHHSVTFVLIYLSYTYGYVRVGCMIMVLLDIADPPLHIAKQFNYLKNISAPSKRLISFSNLSDLFFAIFVIVFTVTRMMMYPYIVWSCTVELTEAQRSDPSHDFFQYYFFYVDPVTKTCITLVIVLQFLQIFWWRLMMNVVIKVIRGQELNDSRSDSESSDFEDNKKKQ